MTQAGVQKCPYKSKSKSVSTIAKNPGVEGLVTHARVQKCLCSKSENAKVSLKVNLKVSLL